MRIHQRWFDDEGTERPDPARRELPARPDDWTPAVAHGAPREKLLFRDAPSLPAMPGMLPEEPTEAAVTATALKAMMATDYQNTDQVRAVGAAVRLVTFSALALAVATLAWGVLYLFRGVGWEWLLVAWLGALAAGVGYLLTTEGLGRKYSSAGIERHKIDAAVAMHRDRLESREAMHQAATEAWENVLVTYLDKWGQP